jgi:hypothetical protein
LIILIIECKLRSSSLCSLYALHNHFLIPIFKTSRCYLKKGTVSFRCSRRHHDGHNSAQAANCNMVMQFCTHFWRIPKEISLLALL